MSIFIVIVGAVTLLLSFVLVVVHAVKCIDDHGIIFKGRAIILAFIVCIAIVLSV